MANMDPTGSRAPVNLPALFVGAAVGVLAGVACTVPSTAAANPLRVKPAVTVRGANVELRGSGFDGIGTVVRIGGKKAEVTRGTRKLLRVVVPKLKPGHHRVAAGRGRGSLRLVRPYAGKIGVRPDTRRAKTAVIGADGGTVSTRAADGTTLTLSVPPAALAAATSITISPAKVRGLPLTGGFSVAAHFAPEGLRFARPAQLTIKLKRRPKGRLVGFGAAGNGTGLGFSPARGNGRTITKDVPHFSVDGAASAVPQDIVIFLQGIIESEFPLSLGQIELLAEQISVWAEMFGPGVCIELCSAIQDIVVNSVVFHIDDACDEGTAAPSLAAHQRLLRLDALRQVFGSDIDEGEGCRTAIFTTIVDRAIAAAALDPLAAAETGELPDGTTGLQLDADERVTRFEWLVFLSAQAQAAAEGAQRVRLDAAIDAELDHMLSLYKPDCDVESARADAIDNLTIAWGYAQRLGELFSEYISAMDYCRLEIDMAPLTAFTPGEQRQLTPRVRGLVDPEQHSGVTWSATGGTVTADGLFTAPDEAGSYTVTVKSVHNPNRTWVAPVTVGCAAPALQRRFALAEDTCEAAVTLLSRSSQLDVDGDACTASCEHLEDHASMTTAGHWDESISVDASVPGAFAFAEAQQDATVSVATGVLTVTGNLQADTKIGENNSEAVTSAVAISDLTVQFQVSEAPVGYEISGTFTDTYEAFGSVDLTCGGASTFSAESDGGAAFGQSGMLEPGTCTLVAHAHPIITFPEEADTSVTVSLTVNG